MRIESAPRTGIDRPAGSSIEAGITAGNVTRSGSLSDVGGDGEQFKKSAHVPFELNKRFL